MSGLVMAKTRRALVLRGALTVAAIAALAVLAVVAVLLVGRSREGAARRFRWPTGAALIYDLALDARDTATLAGGQGAAGGAPLGAHTRLAGTLRLAAYGERAGEVTLGVRLVLDEASVQAAGVEVLGEDERRALAVTEARVTVRPDGALVGVAFPPSTPEPVQNVLMMVVTETAVTLGRGAAWSAAEPTLQGVADSRYRVARAAGGELGLERTRDRYQRLAAEQATGRDLGHRARGAASVTIAGGVIARLEASEALSVGDGDTTLALGHEVTTRLVLRGREPAGGAGPAVSAVARAPGELAVRRDLEAKLRAARIDGLTADELEETLRLAVPTGRAPDHNRFLWRATALLRDDPALCARLADLYVEDDVTADGRSLIADLLVGAGTTEAQAALRDALARTDGASDAAAAGYPALYQRLGLLDEPDAETLALVRAHARAPGAEGREAALASLGAVAGKRLAAGDASAQADVDALVAGLEQASTPDEAVMHLRALANAHRPELEPTLAARAGSPDQPVRRAVARALHGQRGDVARRTLLALAGDGDGEVQRQALLALSGRDLSDDELRGLAAVVERGGVGETGYDALLDVVERALDRPAAQAVVQAVLRRDVQNADVLGRARRMVTGA